MCIHQQGVEKLNTGRDYNNLTLIKGAPTTGWLLRQALFELW